MIYVLSERRVKLGNKVSFFRKKNRLSQKDLAEKLNVSRQFISSIENNKKDPSLCMAIKISKILDVTVEDLFYLE